MDSDGISLLGQAQANRPAYALCPASDQYGAFGHAWPEVTSDITSCIGNAGRSCVAEWLMSVLHPTVRWPLAYLPSMLIHPSREVVAECPDRVLLSEEGHCESDSLLGSRPHFRLVMLRPDTMRLVRAFTNMASIRSARRLAAPTCTTAGAEALQHS